MTKLIIILLIVSLAGALILNRPSQDEFYSPPYKKGNPGDLIRTEPLNLEVPGGGKAFKILYHSQNHTGSPTVSSGVVYMPTKKSSSLRGRPILAWAHGTVGMGDNCAPSKAQNPSANIGGLETMMQNGWVVVATDYSGLGTPGIEGFLIGDDEARDVLNSVRAVRNFPDSQTGNKFVLWGHSQGGHAVLFSANTAKDYAPEVELVAAAAAAPAAELSQIINIQLEKPVMWAIGPEIATSWPTVYKNLKLSEVLTSNALENYERIAGECIKPAALEAVVRNTIGEKFFKKNPTKVPNWQPALRDQTPSPVMDIPLLIVQGLKDEVVPSETTKNYIKKSCASGSNITSKFYKNTDHLNLPKVSGSFVVEWLKDKLDGKSGESDCHLQSL